MKKLSQIGIELIMLIFFVLMITMLIIEFLSEINGSQKRKEIESALIYVAKEIQQEISFASKSDNGYSRAFYLPEDIGGMNYEIFFIKNKVYLRTENKKVALTIHVGDAEGIIKKGNNTIKKENETVYINR